MSLHDAILLLPMDPVAFQEREFALICRETTVLRPMAVPDREMPKISS